MQLLNGMGSKTWEARGQAGSADHYSAPDAFNDDPCRRRSGSWVGYRTLPSHCYFSLLVLARHTYVLTTLMVAYAALAPVTVKDKWRWLSGEQGIALVKHTEYGVHAGS
jgi:hypothetical protein